MVQLTGAQLLPANFLNSMVPLPNLLLFREMKATASAPEQCSTLARPVITTAPSMDVEAVVPRYLSFSDVPPCSFQMFSALPTKNPTDSSLWEVAAMGLSVRSVVTQTSTVLFGANQGILGSPTK